MKQIKIKGSFSDLKPTLQSLKSLMESVEDAYFGIKKQSMEDCQEKDIADIKRVGVGRNG